MPQVYSDVNPAACRVDRHRRRDAGGFVAKPPVSRPPLAGPDTTAAQIKAQCPEAILIFVVPSDFSQIEKRLRARGTDSEEKIQGRLMQARRECERATNYDYVVLNDDPDRAADEMRSIITAEKCKMANRRNYLNMEVSLS